MHGVAMPLLSNWENRSTEEWRSLWGLPVLEIHDFLASTNDRLKSLGLQGVAPWTAVLAEAQTGGRGRGGKRWESPPGKGIWISVLVPSRGAEADALLPIRVGLAVARAGEEALGPGKDATARFRLKWPNDLLVGDRKVGGILCEMVGTTRVVVGIGLNVGQEREDFPEELRDMAVSLKDAFGTSPGRGPLVGEILQGVRSRTREGSRCLEESELQEFAARDALLAEQVDSELVGRGVALGITPRGGLMVERSGGELREVLGGSVSRVFR